MLSEEYRKGLVLDKGYNCAEKVLNLSNEVLDLGLSDQALKVAGGFGGGMGIGHICGALVGAVMVLSLRHVETVGNQSDIKSIEKEFLKKVEEKLGSLMCRDLLKQYHTPERKCEFIIESVLEKLDEYV